MTGRRSKDHHLPTRVYLIRGKFRYVDPAGKMHTLGEAWDRDAKEKWLALSEDRAPRGTVADMLDQFLKHAESLVRQGQRSKRTLADNYVESDTLKLVFGRMAAASVTSRHVAQFLAKRRDKDGNPAPVRANREIALLSSAFSWAMRADGWMIERNPCYGVRRNTERPRTEYVESRNLVAFGKRATTPAWLRGYAVLKRLTGLRQGDMLSLAQANITAKGIEVRTGKTGKALRFRWTWALRITVKWIQEHQPQGAGTTALVLFPNRFGKPLGTRGFRTAWNRAMHEHVAAGGAWITESDIRAKTATDSGSLAEAQARLGHETARTTARHYARGVAKVSPLR